MTNQNDANELEPLEPKYVADEDIERFPEDVIKGLLVAYVEQEERLEKLETKIGKQSSKDTARNIINKASIKAAKKTIREVDEECPDQSGAPISEVKGRMIIYGLNESSVEDAFRRLHDKGEIYNPETNRVKVV